jgi:sepiapterin reductase
MTHFFKSRRVCIILTGASRGFGSALATTFAQHYQDQYPVPSGDTVSPDKLTFVLLARNSSQLERVSEQLRLIDNRVVVHMIVCDLSRVAAFDSIQESLKSINLFRQEFGHFILLHNAGSIGDPNQWCKSISVAQATARNDYYRLNVFSVMELSGVYIHGLELQNNPQTVCHIINISSLAAKEPFTGLVDYCVGKASREAYFRSLVHELNLDPNQTNRAIRVLNYAPGPLDTDMFDALQKDSLVSETFQQLVPLTPALSAEKLLKLLAANDFADGAHVDYYDVE